MVLVSGILVLMKLAKLLTSRIDLVFVVVALVAGGLVTFLLPPLFGNDEIVHFPRAYQIAEGTLWEERLSDHDFGGHVPVEIKDFNDSFRELVQMQGLDKERLHQLQDRYQSERVWDYKRVELAFTSAGVYSPWSYLPSALGVKLASVLNLPIIWYVWLGRLFALIAWIAMTWWALRLLPTGKLFMFAIALLPPSFVQAANLGMDGVVNGLTWVIIAMTFAIMAGKVKLTVPRALLLAGLCFFLATTKQGYMPIALFPLIIPAKMFVFNRKVADIGRVVFGVSLVTAAFCYISRTLPLTSVLHFTQRPGLNVDSHAQLIHIIEHPLEVLYIILIQPFTMYAGGVWAGTVGVMTNKMIYLPVAIIAGLYITLLLAFAASEQVHRFAGKYALRVGIGSVVVGFGTFVLVNLALYVAFTQVAHSYVEGLQGRYFLPFAPLAIGALNLVPSKWHWTVPAWTRWIIVAGSLTGVLCAVSAITQLL
jgi:uncharacterized membrane protein